MPSAYSFVHFAQPRQMRADSRRRRTADARKWASEHGLELDDTLVDRGHGESGGNWNWIEGALASFLLLVKAGRVEKGSCLIVENLGRLSRQEVDAAMPRFKELLRTGMTVVTLDDRQEHTAERLRRDPTSLAVSLLATAQAHAKSRLKAEQLSQEWRRKREAAAASSVITARVPAWLEVKTVKSKRRIVEIHERAEVVRRIFEWACNRDGRRKIAERLNREGVPTFGAKRWHDSYVKKIIENKAVYGECQGYRRREDGVRVPDGEPVRNYYPVVVSEETFERANNEKARSALSVGRPGNGFANVLRDIAHCRCGARMVRENRGAPPKGGIYLVCSSVRLRHGCDNRRRWPLPDAERFVIQGARRLDIDAILRKPEEDWIRAADLTGLIDHLRRQRSALLDLVEDGDEEAKERARGKTAEIRALTARQAEMRRLEERAAAEPPLVERLRRLRELLPLLGTATGNELFKLRERTAHALEALFARVEFSEHNIAVVYRTHRTIPGIVFHRKHKDAVIVFDDEPEYLAEVEGRERRLLEEGAETQEQVARFFARATSRAGKAKAKRGAKKSSAGI